MLQESEVGKLLTTIKGRVSSLHAQVLTAVHSVARAVARSYRMCLEMGVHSASRRFAVCHEIH
jgi:hypothetical protein